MKTLAESLGVPDEGVADAPVELYLDPDFSHLSPAEFAQQFAIAILKSPDYRRSLVRRIEDDDLAPQVETLLYHYAIGKPADTLKLSAAIGREDYAALTLDELLSRNSELQAALRDAQQTIARMPQRILKLVANE